MNLKALHKISYGLYIIGSKKGNSINGQTANALMQVSSDPASMAAGINKQNLTFEYIRSEGYLSVSVLEQQVPVSLIRNFGFKSGRDTDKFSGINYSFTGTGLPYLADHTLAYMELKITGEMDAGTHVIFLGQVTEAEILKEGEPITYAYYHLVKKGKTPSTAPTFISAESKEGFSGEGQYICTVCGYVYDPEAGDPEAGIAPGTLFENLPDDWVCPVCGAGKDKFEKQG